MRDFWLSLAVGIFLIATQVPTSAAPTCRRADLLTTCSSQINQALKDKRATWPDWGDCTVHATDKDVAGPWTKRFSACRQLGAPDQVGANY